MRTHLFLAGLLLSAGVAASTTSDYANRWTLSTDQPGTYAVRLDEGIYRQVTTGDLSDLAAFNADGEELALGPLPPAYNTPSSTWHDAVWFALPAQTSDAPNAGDLQLHVSRSADGSLAMDSTLSAAAKSAPKTGVTDVLIDVRAKDRLIEGLSFDFADGPPDFSAQIEVEASDDLQNWQSVASDAPLASFRQHGQALLRHTVEFNPQQATYLRVHASAPIPLLAVHQLQGDPGSKPVRTSIDATFERRDGDAFVYALPARVPVERLSIALADDNAVARFAVSARETGDAGWRRVGDYAAFRLRGAGVTLDAEPMEIDTSRSSEWRIEPDTKIAKPPQLRFDYQPETWVVLTHGRSPYVLVAGSHRAKRSEFPIDALIGPLRARMGPQWQPPAIGHSAMSEAGGAQALHGWDATQTRTWLLWAVLVLGAGAVAFMVIGLLRAPPKSN